MTKAVSKVQLPILIALIAIFVSPICQAMDLTTPQPEHSRLERLAGQWQFERWVAPGDGGEAELVGSGEIEAEMISSFFVVSRWQGQVMGFDFHGLQVLGYDAQHQEYSGTWVDNFMSYRWELKGGFDEGGEELVIEARGPSPTGTEGHFRERYRFEGPDDISIIAEVAQDDGWQLMTTTRMTRVPH